MSQNNMFWKIYHNLSESFYAGVSFLTKLQAVGLEPYQNETSAQVLSCEVIINYYQLFEVLNL